MTSTSKNAFIVYQAGIANVFEATGSAASDKRQRLLQGCFRDCEQFARGMAVAGFNVVPAWSNKAGDIAREAWSFGDFDLAPFSANFGIIERIPGR